MPACVIVLFPQAKGWFTLLKGYMVSPLYAYILTLLRVKIMNFTYMLSCDHGSSQPAGKGRLVEYTAEAGREVSGRLSGSFAGTKHEVIVSQVCPTPTPKQVVLNFKTIQPMYKIWRTPSISQKPNKGGVGTCKRAPQERSAHELCTAFHL